MARNQRQQRTGSIPVFVFTSETICITQEAMKLFEQFLQRTESRPAKIAFAKETMKQVNGKLDAMSMSVGLMCLTTFDYNEKIILATAIRLYILDLLSTPLSSQREKELRKCRQIERFALDNLKLEQGRAMRDEK